MAYKFSLLTLPCLTNYFLKGLFERFLCQQFIWYVMFIISSLMVVFFTWKVLHLLIVKYQGIDSGVIFPILMQQQRAWDSDAQSLFPRVLVSSYGLLLCAPNYHHMQYPRSSFCCFVNGHIYHFQSFTFLCSF